MTKGTARVRASFNPSDELAVDIIKSRTAELIDLLDNFDKDPRLVALAQTAYEEAAMWAVKAATA